MLGIVQPPTDVIFHPVSAVAVAQQEMMILFTLQEERVT